MSETTPFLGRTGGDDDYDHEDHVIKTSPANSYFKNTLWFGGIGASALSLAVFGLLIASYVFITNNRQFSTAWYFEGPIRELAIVAFVTALVTIPSIFVQIPILLNMTAHIAMSIVLFIFSAKLIGNSSRDSNFCGRWGRIPLHDGRGGYRYGQLPETWACKEARTTARIVIGVSTGLSIAIGILLLAMLVLRIVAVFRTKFWQDNKAFMTLRNWNPTGFTIQFTLSVMKQEPGGNSQAVNGRSPVAQNISREEEARLIET